MRLKLLSLRPRSLAARTAFVLVVGIGVAQVVGLTTHETEQVSLEQEALYRAAALRLGAAYRSVVRAGPAGRVAVVDEFDGRDGLRLHLDSVPESGGWPPLAAATQRMFRRQMAMVPVPVTDSPHAVLTYGNGAHRLVAAARLPDGLWLDAEFEILPLRPWRSLNTLSVFLMLTAVTAMLTWWAARRLIAPVGTLAAAADALGRDMNAPPLPESGAAELVTAARAFNTMAERLRRFVQDRTFMLLAISHDLRTPITRLKLRAEFLEDEELRGKVLADLDDMERMVAAVLAFGRGSEDEEATTTVDLAELARTVLDEAADARPDGAAGLHYVGFDHLPARVRLLAMKRALSNLVMNALAYGGNATVRVLPPAEGRIVIEVDDEGPGIPESHLESVFQPFRRLEGSRNRETGGVGLGLSIVRNIVRAHGGDVTLENRAEGGLRVRLVLPA